MLQMWTVYVDAAMALLPSVTTKTAELCNKLDTAILCTKALRILAIHGVKIDQSAEVKQFLQLLYQKMSHVMQFSTLKCYL